LNINFDLLIRIFRIQFISFKEPEIDITSICTIIGILQKGDGSILYFKHQYPHTLHVVTGTGMQRPLNCKDCNGLAKDTRLLSPLALACGPDGSLYVGDFNLIRKLTPEGSVFTVLQLRYVFRKR